MIGKRRAEFVAMFGALLEEYIVAVSANSSAENQQSTEELAASLATPLAPVDYVAFTALLLEDIGGKQADPPWLRPHYLLG